ncbi:MAG: hypothetical protein DLM67_25175 [Candidatus Nephthysia bennettiae]|nr:MAG: hypothetical protein DLM67_25175 [Candidatus Dormibacteraeota bacterium]
MVANTAWRVLVIAVVFAVLDLLLGTLSGSRPALTPAYLQTAAIALVTGATIALVLLPLARRLPDRMRTRFLALFLPLYWIALLSNLVEASVDTTISRSEVIGAAVIFAIPYALIAWMVARLLPARKQEGPVLGIWESLGDRPLLSWAWRTLVAGILFAAGVEVFGILWGPLISKYYHSQTQIAPGVHTLTPPTYIAGPEEVGSGVVFVLVLLPVLAVMRGRDWAALLRLGAYIALIDAALESWLAMLSMTSYSLGFRIGEGLDLTTDAVARGVFVALLLALPAVAGTRRPTTDGHSELASASTGEP